jgi:hypothetical protein
MVTQYNKFYTFSKIKMKIFRQNSANDKEPIKILGQMIPVPCF